MRQHYLWGLPFLVSKIYYFEVRCSFITIKIFYAEAGKRSKAGALRGFLAKA